MLKRVRNGAGKTSRILVSADVGWCYSRTPFVSSLFCTGKWSLKRSGLSSGVKINNLGLGLLSQVAFLEGLASRQGGLSKGVPLYRQFCHINLYKCMSSPQLVGWLCLTSHRQQGHLETAPPFTVPCEGREARWIHHFDRELNPGPSHGSPLRYRCATQAPQRYLLIDQRMKRACTDISKDHGFI